MSLTPPASTPSPSAVPRDNRVVRLWRVITWVAVAFSLLLGSGMLIGHGASRTLDPLKSPELRELKERLRQNPADEQLKTRIRTLDLQLRQSYFLQISRKHSGVYLLLAGVAVVVFATTQIVRHQKQAPMPKPRPDAANDHRRAARTARWSVAACGACIGVFLLVLSLKLSPAVPDSASEVAKLQEGGGSAAAANDAASADELLLNWPRFRGPAGSGFSLSSNAPVSWDTKTGAGILWKIAAPAIGFNSPIVWGSRLFISGGDANQRAVICLDAATGKILWRQPVVVTPAPPTKPEIPDSTGFAAATMATDGKRVYVFFANGDLAALSLEGKLIWSKNLGTLKNPYGHATSLATWRDRVILQLDQGESEEGKSKLYAFDGRNGQVVWQQPRKVGSSWASPVVFESGGKAQIITLAVPWVISYSATDGAELWRVEGLNGEITPSPIFASGLVIAVSPSEKLMAIRPDGSGDVSKTHVVWSAEDNVPDVTSPSAAAELIFALTTSGTLTCFDAKDGKKQWEHDFEMECHASPSVAGNRIYVFGEKGTAVVVEVARQYKELFRTEMGDKFSASPAIAQDKIFLRGVTNVWCLGTAGGDKTKK